MSAEVDELLEFCERVLGPGSGATEAAREALETGERDRIALFVAASRACRSRNAGSDPPELAHATAGEGLQGAVTHELAAATARLPERQREALALSELSRLSHAQTGSVMGIGTAAVAPLLARARLRLRDERRGASAAFVDSECPDRERALRALALRQDSEPLTEVDGGWLQEHLGDCEHCQRAHAAMLEASVCYRAWPKAAHAATDQ